MMFTRKRYLRKLWFLAGVMAAAVIAGVLLWRLRRKQKNENSPPENRVS